MPTFARPSLPKWLAHAVSWLVQTPSKPSFGCRFGPVDKISSVQALVRVLCKIEKGYCLWQVVPTSVVLIPLRVSPTHFADSLQPMVFGSNQYVARVLFLSVKRCRQNSPPFLRLVSSFPGTVRPPGVVDLTAAAKVSHVEKPIVSVAGLHGGQHMQIANLHHLQYHESPEDRMTRLRPSETGLSMHVNISAAQPQEFPCIYVSKTTKKGLPGLGDLFSVTIPPDPYYGPLVHGDPGEITGLDLQQVYKFVMLNRQTLLVFWYQLDGCESYMDDLQSIR
ncbi:hypothetical protein ABBQ38_007899 [Trebouxia sp. C0009 RCD-2024]